MPKYEILLHEILDQIEELKKQGQRLVSVFDLDSTLYNVTHRTKKIIEEFHQYAEAHHKFPQEMKKLKELEIRHNDWGIISSLHRIGIDNHEFFSLLKKYWRKDFFSNEYLKHDVPYEGAVEFVKDLHSLDVEIVYLTGRDQPRMGKGTIESLKQWGFPISTERVQLALKPHHELKDDDYKTKFLANFPSKNTTLWFFENEPVIVHSVAQALPHVRIIFMDSVHSGRAEAPEHLPRLKMKYTRKG